MDELGVFLGTSSPPFKKSSRCSLPHHGSGCTINAVPSPQADRTSTSSQKYAAREPNAANTYSLIFARISPSPAEVCARERQAMTQSARWHPSGITGGGAVM